LLIKLIIGIFVKYYGKEENINIYRRWSIS
jgi:hypothetical protein